VCDPHEFEQTLEESAQELAEFTEKASEVATFLKFYENIVKAASSRSCCPVCVRPLDQVEEAQFIEKIKQKIQDSKGNVHKVQAALAAAQEEHNRLKPLASSMEEALRLEKEVARLDRDIKEKRDLLNGMHMLVNSLTAQASDAQLHLQRARNLAERLKEMNKLASEVATMDAQIADYEAKLRSTDGTLMSDHAAQVEAKRREWKQLSAEKDAIAHGLQKNSNAINDLERTVYELRSNADKVSNELSSRELLVAKQATLEQERKATHESITACPTLLINEGVDTQCFHSAH
jgi:DNA repair exonuclease SbcCD ATPase subunit